MKKTIITGVIIFIAFYVGIYAVLSLSGQYEPSVWGSNGVKWCEWAPRGFVSNYSWRTAPALVFMPLWLIDRSVWHTFDGQYSGRYPVHIPEMKIPRTEQDAPEARSPAAGGRP